MSGGQGDLRIGTRRRSERFESVRGECGKAIALLVFFRLKKEGTVEHTVSVDLVVTPDEV